MKLEDSVYRRPSVTAYMPSKHLNEDLLDTFQAKHVQKLILQ